MEYGLRTDGRGMGGVGVFLSGWERERHRQRERERGMGGLLVIIHDSIYGWVVRWRARANASAHACMRMLAFMAGFFIM